MHVLMALFSLRRGGAERVAIDLGVQLKDKGHTVSFVTLTDVNEYSESTEALDITSLTTAQQLRWPRDIPRLIAKFRKIRRQINPDVIQVHDSSMAWVVAFGAGRVPCCHLVQGYPMMRRQGGPIKRAVTRLIDWVTFHRMKRRVVAVSPTLRHATANHLCCNAREIECILNGVNVNRFKYVKRQQSEKPCILFVGTLAAYKHPKRVITAFQELLRRLPSAQLIIVGDGPLRNELLQEVNEKQLTSKVELLGQRRDVEVIMAKAHLLWLFSEIEGLPLVIAEAMATGLPVIGNRVAGICDIIQDERTGYLVEPDDIETAARRSDELLRNWQKYNTFSRDARRVAVEKFTTDKMVYHHEEYMAKMCSEDHLI